MAGLKVNPNGQWTYSEATNTVESFAKSYIEKYQSELCKSEVSLFRRFEDKYIIPKSLKNDLDKLLNKHLTPDYPDKKTKFNLMKSVYFDSKNLDMVKQHVAKALSRFKIRTREYAPDGEKMKKSDFTYLEVKAKHGNVSDKFRIKVPCDDVEGFKKGLPIIPSLKLIKANQHIGVADLVKRVMDINSAMQEFGMRPSCEISYARRAYSDGVADEGFRVTYDEGVKYNVLDIVPTHISNDLVKENSADSLMGMVAGYNPEHHMILEVKHHGNIPDWMAQFLNDHKIVKTNFSKYCYSMAKHSSNKT